MYKKLLVLFYSLFFLILVFPTNAKAATTCSSSSSVSDTGYWYDYAEKGSEITSSYSTPTGPVLDKHAHDRDLTSSDFSSTYVRYFYVKYYKQKVTWTETKTVKTCSDGTKTTSYSTTNSYGPWEFYKNNDYSETKDATITVSKTGGSPSDGYVSFSATATGGDSKKTTTTNHRSYYVNKVVVTVDDDKTYVDEPFAGVSCTKYYGFGVGDKDSKDCYDDLKTSDSKTQTTRTICYIYEENGNQGKDCTTRVYVKSVNITGPSKSYTGQHQTFRCLATYYDGTTKYVDTYKDVMSASPYSYIGSSWYNTGYKDPKGETRKPNGLNDFYPADNESRTYTINCAYQPSSYENQKGYLVSDTDNEKTDTFQVNHVGIKGISVDSSGYFPIGSNEYKFVSKVDKSSEYRGTFTNVNFITGHWYDFRATLTYNDGTTKDITSAPEVFWTGYPWYPKTASYEKPNPYDTGMTSTGLGHRIPADGENTVLAEYFNRNVPYGGNSGGGFDNSYGSRGWTKLNSRQITKLEIRGDKGYSSKPATTVNVGDQKKYTAWVTWSDGTKEDWTSSVIWSGDYLSENGLYDFNFEGNDNKTTVSASFNDIDLIEKAGSLKNWDSTTGTLEVTIKFDCDTATKLVAGCDAPSGNWQTEPQKFFEKKNYNFLPPPSAFGYDGSSWTEADGSYRDEYPYNFNFRFNVSGISEGSGRN